MDPMLIFKAWFEQSFFVFSFWFVVIHSWLFMLVVDVLCDIDFIIFLTISFCSVGRDRSSHGCSAWFQRNCNNSSWTGMQYLSSRYSFDFFLFSFLFVMVHSWLFMLVVDVFVCDVLFYFVLFLTTSFCSERLDCSSLCCWQWFWRNCKDSSWTWTQCSSSN